MIAFLAVSLALLFSQPARPAAPPFGLPAGAVVIETRTIPARAHPNRAFILWMLKPKKNPLSYGPAEYTCPDWTRGSYYSGPTRVSLVDVPAGKIINTIDIKEEPDDDTFDIPYKIRVLYYQVQGVGPGAEGKPEILALKDYNGDGQALEFALFDAQACMGLQTSLIGYSARHDRVVQYPIVLTSLFRSGPPMITTWIDYLFSKGPTAPRYWKYEIDYRGRGGTLNKYEIRYNEQLERFEGTFSSTVEDPWQLAEKAVWNQTIANP